MPIQTNDRVVHCGHPGYGYGTVKLVEENLLGDECICQVAFEWVPGLAAVPEGALRVMPKLVGGQVIGADDWGSIEAMQRRLGAALVMAENSQTAAFIRSFTMPLPHQAFLLEKILTHRKLGHVIADDVGMGKTIEAGLIMVTLRQRDPQCRVLVLCPAGVVLQWQDEMEEHFGLVFSIAGRDFAADRKANWDSHPLVLASLDTLKQERLRDILKSAPPFDLVVCDEAHRLTARREFLGNDLYRTQSYRFVEWLVQERIVNWEVASEGRPRSPRLLLMSATPHQGDDLRFAYLLQLCRPDKIEAEAAVLPGGSLGEIAILEECLTRTSKKRAVDWTGKSIFPGHETRTLDIALSGDEKAALHQLEKYVQQEMVFAPSKGEALVRALAMHTFQKIAASSWAALKSAIASRLKKASGDNGRGTFPSGQDMDLHTDDLAFLGEDQEIRALERVLKGISNIGKDSKWETFHKLIRPDHGFRAEGDRILIFTHYRVTQNWLADRLGQAGERVMQIHGGQSLDERKAQRIAFEKDGTILISTEAGSEGANLHRQCHLMVNYDLPWNPMRLLQRIGRLDRYGQKHRVKVANLRTPESWDARISAKIEAKLEKVQTSMGLVAEEDYRSMILGAVHEAINVVELAACGSWLENERIEDAAVDNALQEVLRRRGSLEALFSESLGMPSNYGQGSATLTADDFRAAFSWAAAGYGIQLRETRTSENRLLKGVYHFTLPEAFRGGLRASRECHLVFDREHYAEVRNVNLGRVRGQEIKPTLGGFGDLVTDWFFRGALGVTQGNACFSMQRPGGVGESETWWIVYAARWKTSGSWAGPDAVMICAVDKRGAFIEFKENAGFFRNLQSALNPQNAVTPDQLPEFGQSLASCRNELRKIVDPAQAGSMLSLVPIGVVFLSSKKEGSAV